MIHEPEKQSLEIAAIIANPFDRVDLAGFSTEAIAAAGETLVRQKVSLLGLRDRYGEAVDRTPLASIIERDGAIYRRLRDEFDRMDRVFREDGVQTMVFKSAGLPPSFHYLSSNLDILVPVGAAATARRRLIDAGYVELLNVEEPAKFLFRRFPGDGSTFAIHLHEAVGWGVPFVDSGRLWENARPAPDDAAIRIPGPAEALLVTLAHWFYEDKVLSLGNLFSTAWAVRKLDAPLEAPSEAAARRGWAEGYWAALRVADEAWRRLYGSGLLDDGQRLEVDSALRRWVYIDRSLVKEVRYGGEAPAAVPFARNKLFYYRKIFGDREREPGEKARDLVTTLLWALRWKLHVRSQRPLLVTVSGCDGSGKTLQASGLAAAFDTCDIRRRVVWARGASSPFMARCLRLAKAMGARMASRRREPATSHGGKEAEDVRMDGRRRILRHPLPRWIFALLYAADLWWVYGFKTRAYLWVGFAVVADRYVYDGLVDFALMSGTDVTRPPLALKWLRWAAPRPSVAVLLDVDPAEALRRKPEEGSTRYLQAAREAFLALSRSEKMRVVPSAWSPEEVQHALVLFGLGAFYRSYGTVLNWLLYSDPRQLNPGVQRPERNVAERR
jgi:thymidylate kinase